MRTLYKPGDRGEAWGIKFDFAVFDDAQVDAALADGWAKSPLDLNKQADANGGSKLSVEDAKEYLDSVGVDYAGIHWKKVVALAELHQKG